MGTGNRCARSRGHVLAVLGSSLPVLLLCLTLGHISAAAWPTLPDKATPRDLDLAGMQAWYGDSLPDDCNPSYVAEAEALITAYLHSRDEKRADRYLQELLAIDLPPMAMRSILRHGRQPLEAKPPTGVYQSSITITASGDNTHTVPLALRVPSTYTHAKSWPVIVSLHGTHGQGQAYMPHWFRTKGIDNYIIIAPTASFQYGWGPGKLGRSQVWAAIEAVANRYRLDNDRIYIEGMSMGGAGTKRLAILVPDRFAAINPRSGPMLRQHRFDLYRNLHALPMLSFAGDRDGGIPAKYFHQEADTAKQYKLPATMHVFKGRGHEIFHERNTEALAFFAKHKRQRSPSSLNFASVEDGDGARHYWLQITDSDRRAKRMASNVVDLTKRNHPVLQKLRRPLTQRQRSALEKEAIEAGVILEKRSEFIEARQIAVSTDRKQGLVTLESYKGIRKIRLLIDDDLLDLDKDIMVKKGNRTLAKKRLERSVSFMLQEAKRVGRRDLSWWAAIDISCP